MERRARRPVSHHVKKVFRRSHDPLWQLQLGIIGILILQGFTNASFLPFSKFAIISVEAILLISLIIVTAENYQLVSRARRNLAIILIAIIAVINIFSLIFILQALILSHTSIAGSELLLNGLIIYATNILTFALLYWEMDGGGPDGRVARTRKRDFMFTQMSNPQFSESNWLPGYVDYLFESVMTVAFTSFDAAPLSHRAKSLMMVQSLVSNITVVLVLARAISILH